MNFYSFLLLLCAFIFNAGTAHGAAQVTIVPSGGSSYIIQGSGMDGVSGIELNIRYDTAAFHGTPTLKQESLVSGAVFAANTAIPGSIKVAIISSQSFAGSGPIATVTFLSKTASAPLPSVTTNMIDSKGAAVAATVGTFTPDTSVTTVTQATQSGSTAQQQQAEQTAQTSPSASATQVSQSSTSSQTTSLGTVLLPTDQPQRSETPAPYAQPVQTAPVPVDPPVAKAIEPAPMTVPTGKPSGDTKTEETPQFIVYKGILDRFKVYSGNKNLAAMAAFFNKKITRSIQQDPDPALSNGTSKVVLTIHVPPGTTAPPGFAVEGGTLVTFTRDKLAKGRWNVEILPDAGAVRTTVTVSTETEEFEYPLTIAPLIKTALSLDEAGWGRFLNEAGTTESPLHDFNGDGVRDYIDEYIFVANYLTGKSKPAQTTPTKPIKK